MEENEQNTQGGHKFYKVLLKSMSLQLHLLLLLPVALILTFTSYNYYYLSAFVLPLFTHTFEKKYIFLLCTTILTFITKNIDIFGLKEHNNIEHILSLDAPLVEGNIGVQEYEQEQEPKEDTNDERDSDQEDDGEEQAECSSCVDMDTEELNMKIEEFIRKMKQDLRLEAKQHLITAV
ncbi:uncharacterized protein LOC110914794 [Helianthus annuus]|uniref:uncharacterized protein LOC110914794 n=1 Tax=Helianthus annuus TaxID=4232 RepID=UPI000B905318|nr:uncharacterized protein LOC110914794 [Helianthus annuus]